MLQRYSCLFFPQQQNHGTTSCHTKNYASKNSYVDIRKNFAMIQHRDIDQVQAKKAKLSTDSTNTTSRQIGFEVEQSDAQAILGVQDILLATIHMLELNLSIFPELVKLLPLLCKDSTEPPNSFSLQNVHQAALSTLATQTQVRRGRAKSLLKRLDGVAALVRLPFRPSHVPSTFCYSRARTTS